MKNSFDPVEARNLVNGKSAKNIDSESAPSLLNGVGPMSIILITFIWWASLMLVGGAVPFVQAEGHEGSYGEDHKITICKSTASEAKPFVKINVDKSTVMVGEGGLQVSGENINNIIPPFDGFAGHNWEEVYEKYGNLKGKEIFYEKCKTEISEEEDEYITIHAHKIVCDNVFHLPKRHRGEDITDWTAESFVSDNCYCELTEGWYFQWGVDGEVEDPGGDHVGEAQGDWNTFGPTNSRGLATVKINIDEVASTSRVWVREVLKENHLPFSDVKDNQEYVPSAEMWCHKDVTNYDNYDFILNPEAGEEYYCAAFNVYEGEDETEKCLYPDNLGYDDKVTFGESYEKEPSLQEVLNQKGFGVDADFDQKNYQVWYAEKDTTVKFTVEFLAAYEKNGNVFGYYINGDIDTFEPLFKNKDHSDFPSVHKASVGDHISVEVFGAGEIAFAIHTEGTGGKNVWSTENGLNKDNKRHAVVYEGEGLEEYILAFEDLEHLGDADFNDMIVRVVIDECPLTEPIIPEVTIKADPTTVEKGENTLLTWVSDKAEVCYSDDFETYDATSGTTTVAVYKETEFTVTCESSTGDERSASVKVYVGDVDGPDVWISADPRTVNRGGSTKLTWSSKDVDSCVGVNFDNDVKLTGTKTITNLRTTTKFTIECEYGEGETVSDSVTVTVRTPRSGGGALVLPLTQLQITNEDIEGLTEESTVIVSWDTNLPATSRVVYGTESISDRGIDMQSDTFGYQDKTLEMDNDLEEHYMGVMNLMPNQTYYFRPVSRAGDLSAIGVELSFKTPEGEVAAITECRYLEDYLRIDFDNDPAEVYKLQVFLNDFEKIKTPINGVFDTATFDSVFRFQERYATKVLTPWGHTSGTGYVYITTQKLINEIVCQKDILLTASEAEEIRNYRVFMGLLAREGFTPPFTQEEAEMIRERFGEDVSDLIGEEDREGEVVSQPLEEMEIGLGDIDDEESDGRRKGIFAGLASSVLGLPAGLEGGARNFVMLVLVVLLMYLLTLFFIPSTPGTPDSEGRTFFRRATLFSSLSLVALLSAFAFSVEGLIVPLSVILAVSVIVVFFQIKSRGKPINQELDLGED